MRNSYHQLLPTQQTADIGISNLNNCPGTKAISLFLKFPRHCVHGWPKDRAENFFRLERNAKGNRVCLPRGAWQRSIDKTAIKCMRSCASSLGDHTHCCVSADNVLLYPPAWLLFGIPSFAWFLETVCNLTEDLRTCWRTSSSINHWLCKLLHWFASVHCIHFSF